MDLSKCSNCKVVHIYPNGDKVVEPCIKHSIIEIQVIKKGEKHENIKNDTGIIKRYNTTN